MIKLLLENLNVSLNNTLDYITFPKFKKNCDLIDSIKSSIEADLNRLKLKDPTFLDGPDGHIDYYSPHAEQQLANQRQIIERSIQQLRLLQATLYVFYKYSKEGKSLQGPHVLPNSVEGLRLLQLKKETIDLLSVKSLDEMEARLDIQEALTKIKEYNEAKQQLKETELELKKATKGLEKTKLETKQAELALKIKDFEQEERPGFLTIAHELSDLNRKLLKHEKIKSQLPKGMQDIKRALSLVNEIKAAQLKLAKKQKELTSLTAENPNYFTLKTEIENLEEVIKALNQRISFSTNEKDDKDLKDMLEDMRKLMTTSINGYQKLLTSGGDMNAYLHQTTGFYWENLFLYRKTLEAFNQKLKDTPNLTAKGEELAQCVTKALEDVPSLAAINKAVNAVKQVDNKLSLRGTKYNEKVDEYRVKFYKEGAVSITNTILEQEDKPFFFLPYNANNYVLDHPAHVDIIGALGNCYGETQMFLKRINCKSPSVNNICPETELMNFQLDQTRSLSANPETQGTFTASNPGDFAKWDTIKDFITKPATSTAHGDVCYLRFSGARVPGHDADVAHAMGLIKFTNPDPYKYIVYDYNLGAMGFSTETQLQTFFKQIFEAESGAYYPYSKCVMQKVDEVTPECANFINGVNGIQSLKKANPNASCTRNYWQPHRLELFIKHLGKSQDDLKFTLDKIQQLPEPQQEVLYQKLIEHPNANKTLLFSMAIKSKKLTLIEQLAKSTHDFAYTEKTELPKEVVEQLISLIQQEQITPARALKLVPNHKTIFLAAFNKDPSCISTVSADLVKAVYETSKDPLLLKYATKNQLLSLIKATKNPNTLIAAIDPKLIVELINENKFTTKELEACSKALNGNEAVILAAFNKNPKVLANASVDLMLTLIEKEAISAEKACQVFATNEKVVSAAVQHKPEALSFVQAPMVIKLLESNITSAEEVCSTFPNNEQLVLEAYKHKPKALEALPFEGLVERLVKKGQISAQDAFAAHPEQEGLAKAIACSKQLAEMTALQVTGNYAQYAERAQQLKELYLKNKDYPLASTDQQLTKLVKNLCEVLVEELKKQSIPVSKETSQSIKRLNGDKLIALMQDLAKRNEQAQPKEVINMVEVSVVDEEEKFDPVQDAKQVLSAILKAQVGTKDSFITAYCSLKRRELEQCQHKPEKVNVLLAGLKKTYEAVNSPEMQAIKLALDNLANGKKTTLFGGHKGIDPATTKINQLETALYKVPLSERLNVCTNANNEQCVQVQKILATLKPTEFSLPSTEPMIATRGTV